MRKTISVSSQGLHKPSCTANEAGWQVEMSDLRRGDYTSHVAKKSADRLCSFNYQSLGICLNATLLLKMNFHW